MLISLLVWAYVAALFVLVGKFYYSATSGADPRRDRIVK